MKAIGGYPELELSHGKHYHMGGLRLNTARNCLEHIIRTRGYTGIYIPYYTCEAVLEPIKKLGVGYRFYHVDSNLDPAELPELAEGESFLYTNYFGLKSETTRRLAEYYGNTLILDNAQAFFEMPIDGIDTYYSARKFFGVPDGAYLYMDSLNSESIDVLEQDISYNRMDGLLKRIDLSAEDGYRDFQNVEESLRFQPVKRMSRLTEAILGSIDYDNVAEQRRNNYLCLEKRLGKMNRLNINLNKDAIPLSYPFRTDSGFLKTNLIKQRIYCPTYWPNVFEWCSEDSLEHHLASEIITLPVDQRYNIDNMNYIVNSVNILLGY